MTCGFCNLDLTIVTYRHPPDSTCPFWTCVLCRNKILKIIIQALRKNAQEKTL